MTTPDLFDTADEPGPVWCGQCQTWLEPAPAEPHTDTRRRHAHECAGGPTW